MRVLVVRGRISLLLVRGRGRRLLLHTSVRTRAKIGHVRRDCPRERDPGLWENAVPVSRKTGVYRVHSSTP